MNNISTMFPKAHQVERAVTTVSPSQLLAPVALTRFTRCHQRKKKKKKEIKNLGRDLATHPYYDPGKEIKSTNVSLKIKTFFKKENDIPKQSLNFTNSLN